MGNRITGSVKRVYYSTAFFILNFPAFGSDYGYCCQTYDDTGGSVHYLQPAKESLSFLRS